MEFTKRKVQVSDTDLIDSTYYWGLFFRRLLEESTKDLEVEERTQWEYVDGEEGDYGVKQYLHNSVLIGTHSYYPGDDEDVELTVQGKRLILNSVMECLRRRLTELKE